MLALTRRIVKGHGRIKTQGTQVQRARTSEVRAPVEAPAGEGQPLERRGAVERARGRPIEAPFARPGDVDSTGLRHSVNAEQASRDERSSHNADESIHVDRVSQLPIEQYQRH